MVTKEEAIIAECFRKIQEGIEGELESGEISLYIEPASENTKELLMPSAIRTIALIRITEATKWN